jgi:hypothetical protein
VAKVNSHIVESNDLVRMDSVLFHRESDFLNLIATAQLRIAPGMRAIPPPNNREH